MKTVLCVGYRQWALNIYDRLSRELDDIQVIAIRDRARYSEKLIQSLEPDLILFYGWSWIVPDWVVKKFTCLMLHPSALPQYRGGSPLQNQIIRGVKESAVTIFKINERLDAGDIVAQEPLSLSGELMSEIAERIERIGFEMTKTIIREGYRLRVQSESEATVFKRIEAENNELTLEELATETSDYIFNKIRMLTDPYPNAYINLADGKRLLIKHAVIAPSEES